MKSVNERVVADFYHLCFDQKQPKAAFDRFVAAALIQHNPGLADGAQSALASLEKRLRENPEIHFEIRHIIAEGNLVVVHALIKSDRLDRGRAVVDIFRVSQERIVEHWDIVQPMPELAANPHPMF